MPPAVEAVVQLALSKFPNERQQSAPNSLTVTARRLGVDFWEATAPEGWEPQPPAQTQEQTDSVSESALASLEETVPMPTGPFHVMFGFEVKIPERMAAAKLRGFVEDFGAEVLASEPGLIRMRLGVPEGYREAPKKNSGLFSWLSTRARRSHRVRSR